MIYYIIREKTVAEAKAEIEAFLDAHFPLIGEKNGIKNEVYKIVVRKIPNTEYHIFNAWRTLSYNGIRVKEHTEGASDVGIMGEAVLCESDKVDIILGFVNCFSEGSALKTYEEFLSFSDVLAGLSNYLTGDTTFDITSIGMEYRMMSNGSGTFDEKEIFYNFVPAWCFIIENPNDEKMIRVYINIETGEMESYSI